MEGKRKGFTLIELLIVIAIIGMLASVLVVSINPAGQLAKARDTDREADLISILAAVYQYTSEHSGDLPDTDGDPETSNFPTSSACIGTDVGCFDLASACIISPAFSRFSFLLTPKSCYSSALTQFPLFGDGSFPQELDVCSTCSWFH